MSAEIFEKNSCAFFFSKQHIVGPLQFDRFGRNDPVEDGGKRQRHNKRNLPQFIACLVRFEKKRPGEITCTLLPRATAPPISGGLGERHDPARTVLASLNSPLGFKAG